MLSTKNLIITDVQIPSTWVFEYYLDLPEKLAGQDVKIKSVFNPSERTPSMCIFIDDKSGEYKFKDFSSGKYGSKIDLVKELHSNVNTYSEAVFKIIQDFNSYVLKHGTYEQSDFKQYARYKVDFTKTRNWNTIDKDFWLKYGIGASILSEYNVKALEYYKMSKEEDSKIKNIKIKGPKIYGYFDKSGKVYKIYQPSQKKYKFIKVSHHIQGLDQLKYSKPYLVICSSLKDAMALRQFKYNIEIIAPDSENVIIKAYVIDNLRKKYEKVITLFDNDKAGRKAIQKYYDHYAIKGTVPDLSKDVSDSVKEHGFKKTHENLNVILKKILK